MKRSLLLIVLLLAFGASELQAQAPVKHFLLEEFTGSWCGWCPRGIYGIQQMEEKYPSQFIPIGFHNGDPMVIAEGTTLQATVPGYPDAWFNRMTQTDGTRNTDPTQWANLMEAHLSDAVAADVSIKNVQYTAATRKFTATVSVKFLQAITGDLRLNMYVSEDSVSGAKGTQYDQTSYLTYRSGYESNPFYTLGHTVPGYQHMHVARAVLGGAWGTPGIIPASVTAGSTYTQDFTYTLPAGINPEHVNLIGLAFAYNASSVSKNEVFNAIQVKLTDPSFVPTSGLTITADQKYITAKAGGQTTQTVTVHNSNSTATQAYLAVDKVFSSVATTTGWQGTISPQTMSIPANGSAQATLTFTTPANAGYVNAVVGVTPILSNGETGISTSSPAKVNALSAATKYIAYGNDAFINSANGMAKNTYGTGYAGVGLDSATMTAYPPTSFDVAIFPAVFLLDYQNLNGAPPPVAPTINAMLDAGKKVLLTSEYAGYFAFDAAGPYYNSTGGNPTDEMTKLITKLGITYSGQVSHTDQNGNRILSSPIKGVANDVIGNGITGTCNDFYYDTWDLTGTKGVPFLYFDNDPTLTAGLRYDFGSNQRMVYLDFDLQDISSASIASKILTKSMDFLVNGVNAVEPGTATSFSLGQNYPNPVASETKIGYSVSERTPVSITVHDVLGREVGSLVNTTKDAGTYSVNFDASKLSAGAYIYTMNAGGKTIEKTMTVTK